MSALTNPADEARVREIVREGLADALKFTQAHLKHGDGGVSPDELSLKGQESLRDLRECQELCLKIDSGTARFTKSVEHALHQRLGNRQLLKKRVRFWVIQKLGRLISHQSSPSVECGAPTVGETAAPDGLLRDSSGAATKTAPDEAGVAS